MKDYVEDFPKLSIKNRDAIKDDTDCGCYFCLRTFKGSEIDEWIKSEGTALCPNCGIDSVVVLTDTIKEEDLSRGLERWFTGEVDEEFPYIEDSHPEIKEAFYDKYNQGYLDKLAMNDPAMPEILWAAFATGYLAALENKNDS